MCRTLENLSPDKALEAQLGKENLMPDQPSLIASPFPTMSSPNPP